MPDTNISFDKDFNSKTVESSLAPQDSNMISLFIFLFVVFVVLIFILLYLMNKYNKDLIRKNNTGVRIKNDRDFVDMDIGSTNSGYVELDNGKALNSYDDIKSSKKGDKYVCLKPYYGPKCNLESWDNRFYSFGYTTNENIQDLTASSVLDTDSKTWNGEIFSKSSCSSLSLDDSESIGFSYHNNECRLLYGNVTVLDPNKVGYNPSREEQLYLKRGYGPRVPNMVYIGSKSNGFLRHYIDRPTTKDFVSCKTDLVKEVNIKPYSIFNPYNYVGIWSVSPFTLNDFNAMVLNGSTSTYKIDNPSITSKSKYKFVLPTNMMNKNKYYVMYANYSP